MHDDEGRIGIDRVHPDETEALLGLYVDLFYDREPLTKSIGLEKERMIEVARSMYLSLPDNPLARNLCWVARDRFSGNKAVGFIVCDDPAVEGKPPVTDHFTDDEREKLAVLQALMEAVRQPEKDRIAAQAGRCQHIAAIGVAPGYEGAGIATRLLQTALADAADRGFAHVFSECTSIASQKCHEKNGFRTLHCISANGFVKDGLNPFSDSPIDIFLLWKDL